MENMDRPALPLLPDLAGEAGLTPGLGLSKGPENMLALLAEGLDAVHSRDGADVLAVVHRTRRSLAQRRDESAWRGLMALALLWDTWADTQGSLHITEVGGDTPFSAAVLAARRPGDAEKPLRLILFENHGAKAVLGLAHEQMGVVPAAQSTALQELLPERVAWYDREKEIFTDPSEVLNERDRAVLIHRLGLFEHDAARRFASSLLQAGLNGSRALSAGEESALAALRDRAVAVCGLKDAPGMAVREEPYAPGKIINPLLEALGMADAAYHEAFHPQLTYLWRGRPFARSCSLTGLEAVPGADAAALEEAADECRLMGESARWQKDTAAEMTRWLQTMTARRDFAPAAREHLEEACRQAAALGKQPQRPVLLRWPWAKDSAAVARLIREALGEGFVAGALAPFSPRLALLTDAAPDALGDPVLLHSCTLPMDETGMPCVAVPPLSPELGMALAAKPDALLPERVQTAVTSEGAVEISFVLRGENEVCFVRTYGPEEIVLLSPRETPTVAVWPSVAFAPESWRAYHVYSHGPGLTVRALSCGKWTDAGAHLWSVLKTETFPAVVMLWQEDVCLGALLNQLPPFCAEKVGPVTASIDLGMSGTAVAMHQGEAHVPMQLPCLVRTLLRGWKAAPFEEEFLPAEAINGVLPSAAALYRDVPDPVPLTDGHTGGAQPPCEVFTSLKWASGSSRRARRLHLRQTMLTAALWARMHGGSSLDWRIALPSDLAETGRKALVEDVKELASLVALESCLPLPVAALAVRCMDGDAALAAYMKAGDYQRGSFLSLDVGAGLSAMQLWLRGMSRPCAAVHLPLGVQTMLMTSLIRDPQALEEDFASLQDSAALETVRCLTEQLRAARGSRKALDRCALYLEECLGRHGMSLTMHMNSALARGEITLVQSLLLCGYALLLTSVGLQVERVWLDATLNDHLPQEIPLCLAGRGGLLLSRMPDTLKMRLLRFLRLGMSINNRVRALPLTAPDAPKMEIALGMSWAGEGVHARAEDCTPLADDPLSISLLLTLRRFLTAFHQEFPDAARRLYPNLMEQGQLTDEAEDRLYALSQMHTSPSPAAMAACLEQLREGLG